MRRTLAGGLVWLAGLGASAAAQDGAVRGPDGPSSGRLVVTGHASLALPPDFATVTVGVETPADTPGRALQANSAAAKRVIDAVRGMNVAADDVKTASVSLETVTRGGGRGDDVVLKYVASNRVTVRVRSLPSLGDVLARVVEVGANRIEGIAFGIDDPSKVQDEARGAAMRDARHQAEVLAAAANMGLGPIERLTAPAERSGPGELAQFRSSVSGARVPIADGLVPVTADVSVVWRLAP